MSTLDMLLARYNELVAIEDHRALTECEQNEMDELVDRMATWPSAN